MKLSHTHKRHLRFEPLSRPFWLGMGGLLGVGLLCGTGICREASFLSDYRQTWIAMVRLCEQTPVPVAPVGTFPPAPAFAPTEVVFGRAESFAPQAIPEFSPKIASSSTPNAAPTIPERSPKVTSATIPESVPEIIPEVPEIASSGALSAQPRSMPIANKHENVSLTAALPFHSMDVPEILEIPATPAFTTDGAVSSGQMFSSDSLAFASDRAVMSTSRATMQEVPPQLTDHPVPVVKPQAITITMQERNAIEPVAVSVPKLNVQPPANRIVTSVAQNPKSSAIVPTSATLCVPAQAVPSSESVPSKSEVLAMFAEPGCVELPEFVEFSENDPSLIPTAPVAPLSLSASDRATVSAPVSRASANPTQTPVAPTKDELELPELSMGD
ncbi:MAG: hypothetical protein PHE53_02295 [Thermoguttaceae bacterium]|nr:hypothetical protein [Thermoguttaceae bacterium]